MRHTKIMSVKLLPIRCPIRAHFQSGLGAQVLKSKSQSSAAGASWTRDLTCQGTSGSYSVNAARARLSEFSVRSRGDGAHKQPARSWKGASSR